MTDPDSRYYGESKGTLSGFIQTDVPTGNPILGDIGWSAAQIRKFLLNESDVNFATNEWVLMISQIIGAHIADRNNPHQVTLDQISPDFIKGVLTAITTGTPPMIAPFFSYEGVADLPFGTIFPVTYSTTNLYRLTDGGAVANPDVDLDNLHSDTITGKAGIPLFTVVANIVPDNWTVPANAKINTTVDLVTQQITNYPFNFYTVTETAAENASQFGVRILATQIAATVHTTSFFVLPTIATGSLLISQDTDSTNTLTVDLTTGVCVCSTPAVQGECFVMSNGLLRISFSCPSNTASSGIKVVHINSGATSSVRAGIDGRLLFSIAHPTMTQMPLNHPILVNRQAQGASSVMTVNMARIGAPTTYPDLTVTMSLNMYPLLSGSALVDTNVFSFGTLTIKRFRTTMYVRVNGVILYTWDILPGLNNITVSYSANQVVIKELKNPRASFAGPFATLTGTDMIIGTCAGYLNSMALYSRADKTKTVEYLTNG